MWWVGYGQAVPYDPPLGMAYRRGRRFWSAQPRWGWRAMVPDEEKQLLEDQQNWLKEQLDAVTRRIDELNKPSE